MTITGLEFGYVAYTSTVMIDAAAAYTASWSSTTSVHILSASSETQERAASITVAAVAGTLHSMLTFDGASQSIDHKCKLRFA